MILHEFLNWIFPQGCLVCQTVVESPGICSKCWQSLEFITKPHCLHCCKPYPYGVSTGCLQCINSPHQFTQLRSALKYNRTAKNLVVQFKNHYKMYLADTLANWMIVASTDVVPHINFVTAVPLHWSKVWWRGYNQSEVLAKRIAEKIGKPYVQATYRTKFTRSQGHYDRMDRQKNVTGVFRTNSKLQSVLHNQHILLVDDVTTTKATLNSVAKTLKESCNATVYCVTIAQT